MTIMCPAEFAAATRFAEEVDRAIESAAFHAGTEELRKKLERKRGQGTKTLLACFGYRAQADDTGNKEPYFPDESGVRYPDGTVAKISSLSSYDRPIQETFVFADMAPHSFFFREEWIDPSTRRKVDIFDRCWYVFKDGKTQEEVDTLSDEELEDEFHKGEGKVERTYHAASAEEAKAAGHVTAETMRKRVGMCGGIIYHAEWEEGGRAHLPYGSWSTHT